VLVALDRLAVWAESQGWLYWRHRAPSTTPGGSGILADLIQVFQPAQRHVVEERDRQRLSADEQESSAPPLGVDLEHRVVRLPATQPPAPPPPPV
jgi:hypothetical protein